MTHADPSPRSPKSVIADRAYAFISAKPIGASLEIVVLHRGTERHFLCYAYSVDSDVATVWVQVKPVQVTRTEWRRCG